jgi:hypothetical protein
VARLIPERRKLGARLPLLYAPLTNQGVIMTKAKNSFILYFDQCETMLELSDQDAGRFFKIIINYQIRKEKPNFQNSFESVLFNVFKAQFDRDAEKYAEKCKIRAESGKLGGRPKTKANGLNEKQTKAKKPKAFFQKQNNPDNENDNVNENDNENDIKEKKEIVIKKKSPELSEVKTYAQEIELSPEQAEAFFDHFTANGWKVGGKAPMKDWQSALRNWKRNAQKFDQKPKTEQNGFSFAPPSIRHALFFALQHSKPLYKVNLDVWYGYNNENGWKGPWKQNLEKWFDRVSEQENNPARRFLTLYREKDEFHFKEFMGAGVGQKWIDQLYGISLPILSSDLEDVV